MCTSAHNTPARAHIRYNIIINIFIMYGTHMHVHPHTIYSPIIYRPMHFRINIIIIYYNYYYYTIILYNFVPI